MRDWDEHWREQIASLSTDHDTLLNPLEGLKLVQHSPWLRRHGFTRVLIAGAGIDLTAGALAHCGLEVCGLDISAVAVDFVTSYIPRDRERRFFFQLDEDGEVGDFYNEYAAPGGSVRYVCGDFMDATCEPGPFDLLIVWRSLQHLQGDQTTEAIHLLDQRLAPSGIWRLSVQNNGDHLDHCLDLLGDKGYEINPWPFPSAGRFVSGGIASG